MAAARERFQAPQGTFTERYNRAVTQAQASGEPIPLNDIVTTVNRTREKLREDFRTVFIDTQERNADWAEGRFELLRQEFGWSIDGVLVFVDPEENARVFGRPWSTYATYASGQEGLTMDNIIQLAQERQMMLYPLTPKRDSTLFWLRENDEAVRTAIGEALHEPVAATDYPIDPNLAPHMPDMVRMTHIPRGVAGTGRLANVGLVSGRLGFWENISKNLAGAGKYIPRVNVEKSRIIDTNIIISPLRESGVVAAGGLPMDEKYDNLKVVRTDEALAQRDFIAAALRAFYVEHPDQPLVLSYNTYKPWLGEAPKHGGK